VAGFVAPGWAFVAFPPVRTAMRQDAGSPDEETDMRLALALFATLSTAVLPEQVLASADAALARVVAQRLRGDRTGACLAVAVVERGQVARAYQCADDRAPVRIGADSAFEIGSVSKTMTAALLADLIRQGNGSLEDPLSAWLPAGTKVPAYEGQPILLRHVVTHTSGLPALPPGLEPADPADPYARLDAAALLSSLGEVRLAAAPGSGFEYSNYASMLLSYAVARRAGSDLETLLARRLFAPLGMTGAYIEAKPAQVRAAVGHRPGAAVPAWHFATDLAGVGGVRATLEDMVRYAQAQLGWIDAPIVPALAATHAPLSEQPAMGMNWMRVPVNGRTTLMHEGGTGGFSSFVALDPERQRAVVVLSDTSWTAIGGLGSLGLHLVDPAFPLGKPRREVAAAPELLQALAGEYQLQGTMKMVLRPRDGRLYVQADGQAEQAMGHDDAGDFHALQVDAVLRPQRRADGSYGFVWSQMGAEIPAVRVDLQRAPPPVLSAQALEAYAGSYPLMPGFVLEVRGRDGRLHAQASGQGEFALDAVASDAFEAPAYGIQIRFLRGADGGVRSLELHQAGQVLRGTRQ